MKAQHIIGTTTHARRGALKNAFRYSVDYALFEPDAFDAPASLRRNSFGLWSLDDRRHGGPRGAGFGVEWFRETLAMRGYYSAETKLMLLTQPSFVGIHFNPVSFWLAVDDGQLVAFVAEVNNTFGHRHCYFCAHDDFRPIKKTDAMHAEKLMHVSPFQQVEGDYTFHFDFDSDAINIRIAYKNGDEGVIATLTGPRRTATNLSLMWSAIRRPLGAGRVVALIYWQALKLYLKRAPFKWTPPPPEALISGGPGQAEKKAAE